MKDILGQDIVVGAKVLWGGGKTQYAGFAGGPVEVVKLTLKMVRIKVKSYKLSSGEWIYDEKVIAPRDLVVVDRLLKEPHETTS